MISKISGAAAPFRLTVTSLALLLCVLCGVSGAQESRGQITGIVTDNTGAAIPGAQVTAIDLSTNTSTNAISTSEGGYTIPYLSPGLYSVSVEAANFKRLVRERVEVRVGDRVSLDLSLELGGVQETVTVSGEGTPLLNAASATAGQVIDRKRIADLPLADGNPLTLVRLAPGSVLTGTAFSSGSALSNSGPSSFRVAGGPNGSNTFTLDGSPNTADPNGEGLRVGLQPPTDAVQEFKVVTSSFDAQQGHTAGGSVDLSIRSGQNRVFGTLYEFVRNDVLAANNFFRNRNPVALDENGKSKRETRRYNRYGGTVGGPVFIPKFGEGGPAFYDGRDKTFFFVSYEKIRPITPNFETLTVPTAQMRAGDFSYLPAGQFVYDPASARQVGARVVRTPVSCNGRVNVICPERISPIARQYLTYLPPQNLPGTEGNYSGNGPGDNTYYVFLTRVDHTFNDRHKVFARYSESDRTEIDENSAGTNNGVRVNGRFGTRANRGGVFDYVWTMTPTTIFNFRAGYTRFIQDRFARSDFDLPGGLPFPDATRALFTGGSLPQFNIGSGLISNPTEPTGFFTANRTPSVQPTLTKVAGNHTMRFGYDFRAYQENRAEQVFKAGIYNFDNSFTRVNDQNISVPTETNRAQSMAAFLLGVVSGGSLPVNVARANQMRYHGVFFQDDWKVSRRLTLNLGLRYEYEEATTERFNRNTRGYDLITSNPVETAARAAYATAYAANPNISPIAPSAFQVRGGLLFADENNRGFYRPDKNNLQPRLGFAYQLNEKTVVRAGFAIYTLPAILDGINLPGFTASTPIDATPNLGLSFTATLANPFPSGLIQPIGSSRGLASQVGLGLGTVIANERKNGQIQRYQLNLQRELPGRVLVEASYVGSRGYDLPALFDLNPIPRQYLSTSPLRDQAAINYLNENVPNPFRNIEAFRGTNFFTNTTLQRQQLLRPFPQFTSFLTEVYDGSSSYDSAQLSVERRFAQGYTLLGSYTYSKFLEKLTRLNPTDEDYENRLSEADAPHRVTASGIYELPFGRGRRFGGSWGRTADALIGGFQIQGIYIYQTGTPLTLGNSYFNGDLRDLDLQVNSSRIGAIGTSNVSDNVFGTNINDTGFYTLPNGTIVPFNDSRLELAQNIRTLPSRSGNLRNQAINQFDFSVLKNFAFTENVRLQLRGEIINAFNKAQFFGPNLDPRTNTFGRVTNTDVNVLPRELQLGIKLIF